jgi:hypothetical protein
MELSGGCEKYTHKKLCSENPNGRGNLGNLDVDGRIKATVSECGSRVVAGNKE